MAHPLHDGSDDARSALRLGGRLDAALMADGRAQARCGEAPLGRRGRRAALAALLLLAAALALGALPPRPAAAQTPADAPADTTATDTTATVVVKPGDTLFSLARRYGVSVRALQTWNDLDGTTLRVGQRLRVRPPGAADAGRPAADAPLADTTGRLRPPPDTVRAPSGPASGRTGQLPPALRDSIPPEQTVGGTGFSPARYGAHRVTPGDTFVSLALRYGTAADTLFALNGEVTDVLPPGRYLRLPPGLASATHTVARGETLYRIAGQYGVSVRALQEANGMTGTTLEVGQRLRVPGPRAPAPRPPGTLPPPDATGPPAVYPAAFEGRLMAGGARYDPDAFVVSHPTLPFGAVVLVTNPATGRHTFAVVRDRGPLDARFAADASPAVLRALGLDPSTIPANPDDAPALTWRVVLR